VGVGSAINQPLSHTHTLSTYFNAGVLLINLSRWRRDSIDKRVDSVLFKQGPFEYMDQDVLNLIFNDDWFELDQRFNFFAEKSLRFYAKNRKNVITHFAGGFKPWDYPLRSNLHRQWRKSELEIFKGKRMLWETDAGYILVVVYRFLRYRGIRKWRNLILR
jgi:lipopolysaccharide biosynthesis glycosyltransferase